MSTEIAKYNEVEVKQSLNFDQQLEVIKKTKDLLKKITIKDTETMTIARNTLSDVKVLMEGIKAGVSKLVAPYENIIASIKDLERQLLEGLPEQYDDVKRNIALFQTTNINNATAVFNEKMKENEEKVEKTRLQYEFIVRIADQILARVFGGRYKLKDGTEKTLACPGNLTEVHQQLAFVKDKTPSGEIVTPFESIVEQIQKVIITSGTQLIELMTLKFECDNAVSMAGYDQQINLLRTNTEVEVDKLIKSAEVYLKKYAQGLNKSCENELKSVAKGTRRIFKFAVEDIKLVPVEYLDVNEKKIKTYMKNHDEEIKEGKQPLSGINFFPLRTVAIEK